MNWKPRFSVRQCLIGAVLMALLLTWVRYTVLFQAELLIHVCPDRNPQDVVASLTSEEAIEATLASFESPSDQASAKRLLSRVKAEFLGQSEILQVRLAGSAWQDSREECTQVVDALSETYLANARHVDKNVTLMQTAVIHNRGREVNVVFVVGTILILCFVLYGEILFAAIQSAFLRTCGILRNVAARGNQSSRFRA